MGATEQGRPGLLGRWRQRSTQRRQRQEAAHRLYRAVVGKARAPALYSDFCVPDTNDGRFEMLAVHAALVMRRLAQGDAAAQALGQALFDLMFDDIDRNLRELGVGDLSVGKKVKGIAASFLARAAALEAALPSADEAAVTGILARNLEAADVRPTAPQLAALARYVVELDHALGETQIDALREGRLPPVTPGVAPA